MQREKTSPKSCQDVPFDSEILISFFFLKCQHLSRVLSYLSADRLAAVRRRNKLLPGVLIIPHTVMPNIIKYLIVVSWKRSHFLFSSTVKQDICVRVTESKAVTSTVVKGTVQRAFTSLQIFMVCMI